mmetsp:Transcript_30292/g.51012  ORF Transcript_30292/g.51012 Transcript_30292/m.51012 type:complete len:224 (+) Transcript_30292:1025-1696(+)
MPLLLEHLPEPVRSRTRHCGPGEGGHRGKVEQPSRDELQGPVRPRDAMLPLPGVEHSARRGRHPERRARESTRPTDRSDHGGCSISPGVVETARGDFCPASSSPSSGSRSRRRTAASESSRSTSGSNSSSCSSNSGSSSSNSSNSRVVQLWVTTTDSNSQRLAKDSMASRSRSSLVSRWKQTNMRSSSSSGSSSSSTGSQQRRQQRTGSSRRWRRSTGSKRRR